MTRSREELSVHKIFLMMSHKYSSNLPGVAVKAVCTMLSQTLNLTFSPPVVEINFLAEESVSAVNNIARLPGTQ